MNADAISKLLYGFAYVWGIIHEPKLVDYLPVQTHKPYNNLHIFYEQGMAHSVSIDDKWSSGESTSHRDYCQGAMS